MTKPVKFALIGTGGIAQSYAQAFEANANACLVAVCDVRPDAAKAMADRFGCAAFASPDALAADGPAIDAVLICTPPNTHEGVNDALYLAPEPLIVTLFRVGEHETLA